MMKHLSPTGFLEEKGGQVKGYPWGESYPHICYEWRRREFGGYVRALAWGYKKAGQGSHGRASQLHSFMASAETG